MHDIEPYYKWRSYYTAEDDRNSPFYGRAYDEFMFTHKIYNYFIHPQWDAFGSSTLYMKLLYVDYQEEVAMIELIGEWNDCLNNDVMFIKREIADHLLKYEISKFIIFCDNVLNFHGDDDSYYEEWYEDVSDEGGYVCLVNLQEHVLQEMEQTRLQYYVNMGKKFNDVEWRMKDPKHTIQLVEAIMNSGIKELRY